MPWTTAGDISTRNFRKRGLAPTVAAGLVCQAVQEELGNLGVVRSYRGGVVTIELSLDAVLPVRNCEKQLLAIASKEAEAHGLAPASQVRLVTE